MITITDLKISLLTTLLSLCLSFLIAPIVINILYKLKFRQMGKSEVETIITNRKKSIGVPVMGGIIIVFPFLVVSLCILPHSQLILAIMVTTILYSILGFINDFYDLTGKINIKEGKVYSRVNKIVFKNFTTWSIFRYLTLPFKLLAYPIDSVASFQTGLRPSIKFYFEYLLAIIIMTFAYQQGLATIIWLPFGITITNLYVVILFNATVIVSFINAFSWTDGVDAISPGNQGISFMLAGILSLVLGYYSFAIMSFTIVGAEITFYYFNIPPARIEMSDVGTIPLGFLFALLCILTNRTILSPLLGIVFVIEILSSILQGFSLSIFKKKVFDMAPIHHHFEIKGWSKEKIVMRSYFIQLVAGIVGLLLALL